MSGLVINHKKNIPIKQPVFHGKYPRLFFSWLGWIVWRCLEVPKNPPKEKTQGNNSATRLVALHTGVVGNVGLAMLITNAPPVAFELERVSGGATAAAAKAVIQGKLRMPSTLEQFLHGGEIVKPRELMRLNDLIARRITHLAGPTPRGNAYVGVLQP